jgi:hypothetical protein
VTFFLHKKEKGVSIWNNGATQNCVFLLNLLQASSMVGKVYAINAGHDEPPSGAMMLDGIEFVRLEDVVDELDLLIECGGQIGPEPAARVRCNGGRVVGYRFGNSWLIDMERVMFRGEPGSVLNGTVFDAVWTNAQHLRTNAAYWETVYRCPVRCLPHIWQPTFVDRAIEEIRAAGEHEFGYAPGRKAKRLSVLEPNMNVVKFCGVPLLVAEQAYRRCPDRIEHLWVTNALGIKTHETFVRMVTSLDLQAAKKVSFEGRYNTPFWLASRTDVVVSHQWENGLNYAYYDALYGHYPLVHNSQLLPYGVGYRYDGFDAVGGGRLLASVLQSHDSRHERYAKRCDDFLQTVLATSPKNIQAHERAIEELWA